MSQPVILFDGVCNLCNATVRFVIKRDKHDKFKFASLQSDYAAQLFKKLDIDPTQFDSIVVYENGNVSIKSTAALKIAKDLTGLWPLLYVFMIVPPFLRNIVYDFIARNRYKWFGKQDYCEVPTPELSSRFLDQ